MPTTIKAIIRRSDRKKDNTYNVKLRVTHRRQSVHVATNIYVDGRDLTPGLKIRNVGVQELVDGMVRRWRDHLGRLGFDVDYMDARQVVERLKAADRYVNGFRLDFIAYTRRVAETLHPGTARNYRTAANALERYAKGCPIDVSEVTPRFLAGFERFLRTEASQRGSNRSTGQSAATKGERAVSLYLGVVRAVHNRARAEFNDEDTGQINIPGHPFTKFKVPKEGLVKKRAIGAELLQRIIELEDEPFNGSTPGVRRDLARDAFLLSFGLAGMNAADLYHCPASALKGDVITYNRRKTATRRADRAEMQIRVEPQLAALVDRYRDPEGRRLFRFYHQYATDNGFTRALNIGLRRVAAATTDGDEAPALTFYAARHTWATVARSAALNIDKYTVHEALNHVDAGIAITDRYITRDWTNVWNANAAVLGLFDWAKLEIREMLR